MSQRFIGFKYCKDKKHKAYPTFSPPPLSQERGTSPSAQVKLEPLLNLAYGLQSYGKNVRFFIVY